MESNSPLHGLTDAEAKRLREMGGGNTPPPPITKSASQIILENVCTLFNLFNVLIAAALARFPGDRKRAMEALGLSRRTFYRKLSQHRL